MSWIEAFRLALSQQWPNARPAGVGELRKVLDGVMFTAPEGMWLLVRRAWEVYEDEGNTDVGRAGVALAYAIQAERDESRR